MTEDPRLDGLDGRIDAELRAAMRDDGPADLRRRVLASLPHASAQQSPRWATAVLALATVGALVVAGVTAILLSRAPSTATKVAVVSPPPPTPSPSPTVATVAVDVRAKELPAVQPRPTPRAAAAVEPPHWRASSLSELQLERIELSAIVVDEPVASADLVFEELQAPSIDVEPLSPLAEQ